VDVKEYKAIKGLRSQNLRDHMSEAELIFTALAELSTRQITETNEATGLPDNKSAAIAGGKVARGARQALEDQTGKSVVTGENYLALSRVKTIGKSQKKSVTAFTQPATRYAKNPPACSSSRSSRSRLPPPAR
jgi:DNA-damage-inducible protein D